MQHAPQSSQLLMIGNGFRLIVTNWHSFGRRTPGLASEVVIASYALEFQERFCVIKIRFLRHAANASRHQRCFQSHQLASRCIRDGGRVANDAKSRTHLVACLFCFLRRLDSLDEREDARLYGFWKLFPSGDNAS
jgi:hypothetical protein